MSKTTLNASRALVYNLLLSEGWLPSGTTATNWGQVTVAQLQLDDPELPSDPNFQKKKLAFELQAGFIRLGSAISSPLSELKTPTETLSGLAKWCFDNQVDT